MSICRTTFAKVKGKSKKLKGNSNCQSKSKKFCYQYYKNFDSKLFEETLIKNLSKTGLSLKSFETTFSLTLEKFALLKQKYLRYNSSPFMNRKAIMTTSKLKRSYNIDITTINFENYKK